MKEQDFVQRREPVWKEFSGYITGKNKKLKTKSISFIKYYREITQDLNTARSCGIDSAVIERLNTLVNEGNQILYSQHNWSLRTPVFFILQTFPQKVRSQWRGILAAALLFYGTSFFLVFLCIRFPDMSKELISEQDFKLIENMYNPEHKDFYTPRNVTSDADMFGYYIYNNISIAFRTFAGGMFAGFGSLLFLLLNAGYLGVIEGHLINAGFAKTFFSFVIAHSSFELTAIIFSSHAGFLLGYRFFITGGLSRGMSLKKAGKDVFPIITGSTIMLVFAAIIEAFWSSKHHLSFELRIAVGSSLWILLLLYFLLAGRKHATGNNHEPSD
jgi:uncharacterized membrane protein SpoIIM required for sporulation